LKALKILTVVSFLSITVSASHIGGPFLFFLILYLVSGFSGFMMALPILITLVLFVYSAFAPKSKRDKILFIAGGAILFYPITVQLITEIEIFYHHRNLYFMISLLPFLILYGFTLFKVWKTKLRG